MKTGTDITLSISHSYKESFRLGLNYTSALDVIYLIWLVIYNKLTKAQEFELFLLYCGIALIVFGFLRRWCCPSMGVPDDYVSLSRLDSVLAKLYGFLAGFMFFTFLSKGIFLTFLLLGL